jgi:hypothetical protein
MTDRPCEMAGNVDREEVVGRDLVEVQAEGVDEIGLPFRQARPRCD